MTAGEITNTLQSWLEQRVGSAVDADEPYAASAAVDSFDVFELVHFAEKTFGFRFAAGDFEKPDFASLAGLGRLIEQRAGASR